MAGFVLLLVLQLFMATQFNRVGSTLELSRPLLFAEVARLNRYALEFALVRNLVGNGRLPYNTGQWNIGRPSSLGEDVSQVDQFADIVPFRNSCEEVAPTQHSAGLLGDMEEDAASRLSLTCLLRQFNIRIFSRDNSSSIHLSSRAQERILSASETKWSGRQMNSDLVSSIFASMIFAVVVSFSATFISIACLALGYRRDIMKARRCVSV